MVRDYRGASSVIAPQRARRSAKKSPDRTDRGGKPYRCHHGKAPAQGGKAGNDSLAAIIRRRS
jgi:hypothetical protein